MLRKALMTKTKNGCEEIKCRHLDNFLLCNVERNKLRKFSSCCQGCDDFSLRISVSDFINNLRTIRVTLLPLSYLLTRSYKGKLFDVFHRITNVLFQTRLGRITLLLLSHLLRRSYKGKLFDVFDPISNVLF